MADGRCRPERFRRQQGIALRERPVVQKGHATHGTAGLRRLPRQRFRRGPGGMPSALALTSGSSGALLSTTAGTPSVHVCLTAPVERPISSQGDRRRPPTRLPRSGPSGVAGHRLRDDGRVVSVLPAVTAVARRPSLVVKRENEAPLSRSSSVVSDESREPSMCLARHGETSSLRLGGLTQAWRPPAVTHSDMHRVQGLDHGSGRRRAEPALRRERTASRNGTEMPAAAVAREVVAHGSPTASSPLL